IMPADPERPIEKLLRAARRNRERADAPHALHPATRKLLQGEVARRYGRPAAPRSFIDRTRRFWPGFVLAFSTLILLGLLAVMWRPLRDDVHLARDKSGAEVKPPVEMAAQARPAAPPAFGTAPSAPIVAANSEPGPAKTDSDAAPMSLAQ